MRKLAEMTTLRVGGPPERLVEAGSEEQALAALRSAEGPVLVLAGGSNVVASDDGFPGTVLHLVTRGVDMDRDGKLVAAAGEPWDALVTLAVRERLAGVECLAGIPGSVGATPIQNVGAYGQDVSQTIVRVRVYDRDRDEVRELAPADCGFAYRSSRFKRERGRWLVLAVEYQLTPGELSAPIVYPELARELGVELGGTAPLERVREGVLRVRRRKGMVIDRRDPDSTSAGSFFTNPILEPGEFDRLEARAGEPPPRYAEPDGRIKTSAAWLVERAGFTRGYGLPGPAAISTKHTLAITNRGGATAADLVALARTVAQGVHAEFGIELVPEPVLVGIEWAPLAPAVARHG